MANFSAQIEGFKDRFVSCFDPKARLEGCTHAQYMEDPFEHKDCLKVSGEPEVPIWHSFPTKEQLATALRVAGFDFGESGVKISDRSRVDLFTRDGDCSIWMARMCILSIPTLDGWYALEERTHTIHPSGLRILSDAALNLIPVEIRRPLLQEVGRYLFRRIVADTASTDSAKDSSTLDVN